MYLSSDEDIINVDNTLAPTSIINSNKANKPLDTLSKNNDDDENNDNDDDNNDDNDDEDTDDEDSDAKESDLKSHYLESSNLKASNSNFSNLRVANLKSNKSLLIDLSNRDLTLILKKLTLVIT